MEELVEVDPVVALLSPQSLVATVAAGVVRESLVKRVQPALAAGAHVKSQVIHIRSHLIRITKMNIQLMDSGIRSLKMLSLSICYYTYILILCGSHAV